MNARQRRFVDEYLIDLDGRHAAIRAGYAPSDAKSRACRFLKTPAIVDAIAAAMAERARRTGITPERVVAELARIAFVDWRKLAEPVAALYEQGRVHHVGCLPALEDQLCAFAADFDRAAGASPDRLDALVWAITDLMANRDAILDYYRRLVETR